MSDPTALVPVDQATDGIRRLRLNRPQARHALNTARRPELAGLFTEIDTADEREGMAAFVDRRPARFTGG